MRDTYGLIGYPLTHSFSAKFFNEKFDREQIDAEYLNFEIEDINQIQDLIHSHPRLKGLNVTIPHKEKVIPLLDALSAEATQIGAVNVIRVERKSPESNHVQLTGYNTDYIGFRDSIVPLISPAIHQNALVLGTGGASKAVAQTLINLGINWKYVSRTPGDNKYGYNELTPEIMASCHLIVNASPLGTFPHTDQCPDIPYQYLTPDHLLYDLVYNPEETLFLKKGRMQGATIKNGKEMLEIQARAAWKIWNT